MLIIFLIILFTLMLNINTRAFGDGWRLDGTDRLPGDVIDEDKYLENSFNKCLRNCEEKQKPRRENQNSMNKCENKCTYIYEYALALLRKHRGY